ncbi:MAG TPA: hypothetical protein VEU62_24165 [Bryobacterales bacterium]|nr:hypothetical protein [Bryobacterales bacterium]
MRQPTKSGFGLTNYTRRLVQAAIDKAGYSEVDEAVQPEPAGPRMQFAGLT